MRELCALIMKIIGSHGEKALIAVGDQWDLNAHRKLLQGVTEASFFRIKPDAITAKCSAAIASGLLPSLKTVRLHDNELHSIRHVRISN